MSKKDLAEKLTTGGAGLSKGAAVAAIDIIAAALTEELANTGETRLPGFGTFKLYQTAERIGFNPHTQQKMLIPATTRVRFRAVAAVKQAVN